MTPKVLALWWLTCILWSSVWVFIKIGVTDVPPISLAGLRLALALLILTPVILKRRRDFQLTRSDYALIAFTGFLLLGVNYALVFWGTQFIASGTTAVLQAATPAFGILFAAIGSRRRVAGRALVGSAIGVAGVAAVSANQLGVSGMSAVVGAIAVTAGGACVALAYTVVKARLAHVPPIVVLVGQMVVGCVPLLVAGLLLEGNPLSFTWTNRSVVSLAYLATAGSIAAFWLNLWLLQKTTTSAILGMSIVEPLLAVALGAVVLHEQLHRLTIVGALLILLSVWLVVFRGEGTSGSSSGQKDPAD